MNTEFNPDSWTHAEIGSLCKLINGRAFKPIEWSKDGLPIIRIQNLNNPSAPFNYFNGELADKHCIETGDLLFAWSGTPGTSFGAHVWSGPRSALNQHIFKVEFNEDRIDKSYLRFAINQKLDELISDAHGGVGLRHVTKGKFEKTSVSFPSLAEQKQISSKLEAFLAQVDAIKTCLDAAPAILKRFRQSVLAAALSGRLTESPNEYQKSEVREPWAHTIQAPSNWKRYQFSDVVTIIGGSQPPKTEFKTESDKGLVRLIQIRDYKSDSHVVYIPKEKARRFCSKDDVMIGRYGPPIFQILRGLEGAYNVALMKAEPKEGILDRDYLFWFLQNHMLRNYVEAGSLRTAGQSGVNKKYLEQYPIFLPDIKVQGEIVRRIKERLELADRIEQRIKDAETRVNQLTPSVLAKAFRGELTTEWREQNPDLISGENSATALLKRIEDERQLNSVKKKTRFSRAKR